VIPYPIGENEVLNRSDTIWATGPICFVGRLEPRKGIFEWVDAAISVARERATADFLFVGADTIHHGDSVRSIVERRIPAELRSRFSFVGERPRSELRRFLARARIAAVPSRWENFPYSCMEAMGSGLPAIATREGGMAEMIIDGESGWLAESPSGKDLADSLRRALDTSVVELESMGDNAARRIRQISGNDWVGDTRIDYHRRLAVSGTPRSTCLPERLSRGRRSPNDTSTPLFPRSTPSKGIAVIVTCSDGEAAVDECLRTVWAQTQAPHSIVIAFHQGQNGRDARTSNRRWPVGTRILSQRFPNLISAKNAGIDAALANGGQPLGIAVISAKDRLKPTFVAVCEAVLKTCPDVGVISSWSVDPKSETKGWIRPCPSFPFQWLANDASPMGALRTSALVEAGCFRPEIKEGYEFWDLCNAVLSNGWKAATVPEVLAQHRITEVEASRLADCDSSTRSQLLERFPDLVARDAPEIQRLGTPNGGGQFASGCSRWKERFARALVMICYPRTTVGQICGRLRNKFANYTGD
jgi:glycogen synthase